MVISPDGLLDIIKNLLTQDLTLCEARQHIGDQTWNETILEALELGGIHHPLFQLAVQESQEESHVHCLETQCYQLWMAGWTVEENGRKEAWAWYWRRPPKGKRKVGKLFLSTNQAFNALQRE